MSLDQLIEKSKSMGYGEIHVCLKPEVGLQAFVVIHSTQRGPALGGCRFIEYASSVDAVVDALRLGQGMSYKAAMAGLHYGGGKAVLMRPTALPDRAALFHAFGRFVNDLGGRYITAIDSGSELADMDVVAQETNYVAGTSRNNADPSPHTVQGVCRALQAAVKFQLGKETVKNLHVAVQGLGHVGQGVAAWLHAEGARLTIADVNAARAQDCAKAFDAQVVSPDEILQVACDVVSPCALGNVLNKKTIPLLEAPVVVGGANNQLGEPGDAEYMRTRGILYAPDFVANAGGLIFAVNVYENAPLEKADEKINQIYDTMLSVFAEAKASQCSTEVIAEKIAKERLQ